MTSGSGPAARQLRDQQKCKAMTSHNQATNNWHPSPEAQAIQSVCQLLESRNPALAPYRLHVSGAQKVGILSGWAIEAALGEPPPTDGGRGCDAQRLAIMQRDIDPGIKAHLQLNLHYTADGKAGLTITTFVPHNPLCSGRWIPILAQGVRDILLIARDFSCAVLIEPNGRLRPLASVPITEPQALRGAQDFFWLWKVIVPLSQVEKSIVDRSPGGISL